jgi:hypothetical protein
MESKSASSQFDRDAEWLSQGHSVQWYNTRITLLVVTALLFCGVFFGLAGPSWGLALYRLCYDGGTVALWVLAAAGIGWIVWRGLGMGRQNDLQAGSFAHPLLPLITCIALGIGSMSLIILILGLCGWMNQIVAWGIIIAGACVALIQIVQYRRDWDVSRWLALPASWHWLWAMLMPLLAIATIGAMFPPGMLWSDEPHWYDVVEYHLQVPREWFEAGRIVSLHHNVFSYFPFNVEMHYLLAMHLHHGPWAGMYTAQLMHTAMCALSIIAVIALAGGGARGTVAAVLAGAVPWTMLLAAVPYNEGGTLLFGILAIGWALRAASPRQFALAGALAGFAIGCKLSNAPLLAVGVPLAMLLVNWKRTKTMPDAPLHQRSGPRNTLIHCAIFLIASLAVLSPWLIRNWAWSGNPVFPEMMNELGKGHFSDIQVERWRRAYLPDAPHRSLIGRFEALGTQVLIDPKYGFAFIPLGMAGLVLALRAGRNRTSIYLLLLLLFQTGVWLFFTHLQGRFMVIAIPVIALLIAQHPGRDWLGLCALAAIVLVGISGQVLLSRMGRYVKINSSTTSGFIGRENLEGLSLVDASKVPDDVVVDLVGDAAVFDCQLPMTRLHYKTVFDVDTTDPTRDITADWLAGMPPITDRTAVVVDPNELQRFARTYWGIPLLPTQPKLVPATSKPAATMQTR